MPAVLIRMDASGEWPVLVDEGDELPSANGARWRFVAQVDDRTQGRALIELLRKRALPAAKPASAE